jgi:hypothetical protein
VSGGKATLRDCQEFYSIEDVYDMIEVLSIDTHNRRVLEKRSAMGI